jgi:endoglucanase Acf2
MKNKIWYIFVITATTITTAILSVFKNSTIPHPLQRDISRWSCVDAYTLLTEPLPTNIWWEPLAIGSDTDSNTEGWFPITTYPYQFQFADRTLFACILNTSMNNNLVFQTACQSTWFFLPEQQNSLYIQSFTNTSVNCTIKSSSIRYTVQLAQGMTSIHLNISFLTDNVFNMTTWPSIKSFYVETAYIEHVYRVTLVNDNQWLLFVSNETRVWQTSFNGISMTNGVFIRIVYAEPILIPYLLLSYQYPYSYIFIQTTIQQKNEKSIQYTYAPANWKHGNFSLYVLPHHMQQFRSTETTPCSFFPTSLFSSHGNIALAVCNQPLILTLYFPDAAYNHPFHYSHIPSIYLKTIQSAFINDISTTLSMYISTDCNTGVYEISKSIHRLSLSIQLSDQIGDIAIRDTLVSKLYNILYTLLAHGGFVYEYTWDGIVCTDDILSMHNNHGCGWYNNHHIQYGYIIFAGAVVSRYNSVYKESIQPYIDGLAQDIQKRHFNWFLGHSWGNGLFANERNQQSSSEAILAYWAMYVWGNITDQTDFKIQGQAMVLLETYSTRVYYPSLHSYYPAPYGNRTVTGALFDTSAQYSTFFGFDPEYIHGIHFYPYGTHHLLQLWPIYYTQEWIELQDTKTGNWKSILYGIWSQINQTAAWNECKNAEDTEFDVYSPKSIVLWFIATMGLNNSNTNISL